MISSIWVFWFQGIALKSVTHHSGSSVTYHAGSYRLFNRSPAARSGAAQNSQDWALFSCATKETVDPSLEVSVADAAVDTLQDCRFDEDVVMLLE